MDLKTLTCNVANLSQRGTKNCVIPIDAPGNVTARIMIAISTM